MKFVIALALVAVVAARPNDDLHYDSKYDNFDADELTTNDRLLKNYADCFISAGKCTPEGIDFKKWIPEATKTSCGKCTEPQKGLVAKVVKAIKVKLPEHWDALKKQNDPNNEYDDQLNEFLAKYS